MVANGCLLKGPPAGVVDPPDKSSGDHNLEKPTGRAEKRNAAASTVHKFIYIFIYIHIYSYIYSYIFIYIHIYVFKLFQILIYNLFCVA